VALDSGKQGRRGGDSPAYTRQWDAEKSKGMGSLYRRASCKGNAGLCKGEREGGDVSVRSRVWRVGGKADGMHTMTTHSDVASDSSHTQRLRGVDFCPYAVGKG
jgi:hypothetical protein